MATAAFAPTSLQARRVGTTSEISVTGEIDVATAPALASEIDRRLSEGPEILVIDLRDVDFIDSSGIHLLTDAHRRTDAQGIRLVVLRPPGVRGRIFTLCGVDGLFPPSIERPGDFVSEWSL